MVAAGTLDTDTSEPKNLKSCSKFYGEDGGEGGGRSPGSCPAFAHKHKTQFLMKEKIIFYITTGTNYYNRYPTGRQWVERRNRRRVKVR